MPKTTTRRPRNRSMTDPDKRPEHGPYAVSWWLEDEGRWHVQLTDAGHAEFNRFVAQYGGAPVKILMRSFPTWFHAAAHHPDQTGVKQASLIGVMNAVRKFDPGYGTQIGTMACWYVLQAVQQFIREDGRDRGQGFLSPDQYQDDKDGPTGTGWHHLADPKAVDPADVVAGHEAMTGLTGQAADLLGNLSGREAEVLRMRILDDLPLREIGDLMGISKGRVRQIETRAIAKLKKLAGATESAEATGIRARVFALLARRPGLTATEIRESIGCSHAALDHVFRKDGPDGIGLLVRAGVRETGRQGIPPALWWRAENAPGGRD